MFCLVAVLTHLDLSKDQAKRTMVENADTRSSLANKELYSWVYQTNFVTFETMHYSMA